MAVVNKIIFLWQWDQEGNRSSTVKTLSDCEVDDKISFNFIVNYGFFYLSVDLQAPIIITAH